MEKVLFINHRINTTEQLENVKFNYGVELDLRDKCN